MNEFTIGVIVPLFLSDLDVAEGVIIVNGAQDYDIFLRMSEIVKEKNIKHIPKILYHWRIHKASTAMQGSAKPWAFDAGKKALEDHLKRVNLKGIVKNGLALGTYEIEYEVDSFEQGTKDFNDFLNEFQITYEPTLRKSTRAYNCIFPKKD